MHKWYVHTKKFTKITKITTDKQTAGKVKPGFSGDDFSVYAKNIEVIQFDDKTTV